MKSAGSVSDDIEKIIDFAVKYLPFKDRDILRQEIGKHLKYRTCMVIYDGDEIIAACRWNLSPSGTVAKILDLIIEEKNRGKGLIKRMLLKGLRMYPTVKYVIWERQSKYPFREPVIYPVEIILRRK